MLQLPGADRPSVRVRVRVGIIFSLCPVGCGLVHRVSLLEEFGHFIKDQVEVNCKHNGGKKSQKLQLLCKPRLSIWRQQ